MFKSKFECENVVGLPVSMQQDNIYEILYMKG